MKKIIHWLAIVFLLFNGSGALYGGWNLFTDPTGDSIGLSQNYLDHTLFKTYLIPGIILFVLNGIFSLITVVWTIFRWKNYADLILTQGVILTGWIIIQILMIRTIFYLQFILSGIGIVLILIGVILHRQKQLQVDLQQEL